MAKLTLEQKLDLIGAEVVPNLPPMFIRAEPQLGLPRLKMNDASMGVNTWGPSTAYAASIALPQHGIRFWPDVLVKPSVEMHARAVSTSFLGLQSTSIARH